MDILCPVIAKTVRNKDFKPDICHLASRNLCELRLIALIGRFGVMIFFIRFLGKGEVLRGTG